MVLRFNNLSIGTKPAVASGLGRPLMVGMVATRMLGGSSVSSAAASAGAQDRAWKEL
jgi:hypothetical protein